MLLENRILIEAPQSMVWDITVDVERWPQWLPTVTRVKRLDAGPFRLGSAAQIKQPGLPEARWVVTALTPGERFTWETRIRGIRMSGTHELSTQGTATHSVLQLRMSGLVARLLGTLIRGPAQRTVEQENAALKATCEAAVSVRVPSSPPVPRDPAS